MRSIEQFNGPVGGQPLNSSVRCLGHGLDTPFSKEFFRSASVDILAARHAVEDTVIRMSAATDEHDWATPQGCFTDPFAFDRTSMVESVVGGLPARMSPIQVTQAWAEGCAPLDHVHHQVGNFHTTVTQALVRCYGVAFHHRAAAVGLRSRIFVGTYELALVATGTLWQINHLFFTLKFIDGRLHLHEEKDSKN